MRKLLYILLFFAHNIWAQEGLLLIQPATKTWAINLATFPDGHTLRDASLYQGDCIQNGVGNFNGASNFIYAEYYFSAFSQNATLKPLWNPTIASMTVVNAWAWNAGVGYGSASNTTGYGNLGYAFSSIGSLFTTSNALMALQISGNGSTFGAYCDIGVDNAGAEVTYFRNYNTSTTAEIAINANDNGTTTGTFTAPKGAGYYSVGRNSSLTAGNFAYFNNTSQTLTFTSSPSNAIPTFNIYVGAFDLSGTAGQQTPYTYGSCTIGLGTVNQTSLYHAQQYLSW